jgi:uncharacterized membrane protein YvbJ
MSERFYCTNCQNVGSLNEQLRCSKCGSDAVISCERVLSSLATSAQTRRQPLQAKTLYVVKCGPFACTLYADTQTEAIKESIYRSWCVDNLEDFNALAEHLCINIDLFVEAEPVKAQQTLEQTPR